MLYTRKGDNGTTKLFDCPQGHRMSKADFVFEALGTLDELNSALGYAASLCRKSNLGLGTREGRIPFHEILETCQQNLFCIQAELAGSQIKGSKDKVLFLEEIIYEVETLIPPVKSFIVPGGSAGAAYLDVCRTIARRAERNLVTVRGSKRRTVSDESISFLNRLGSALYALARLANYQQGYLEGKPEYK